MDDRYEIKPLTNDNQNVGRQLLEQSPDAKNQMTFGMVPRHSIPKEDVVMMDDVRGGIRLCRIVEEQRLPRELCPYI